MDWNIILPSRHYQQSQSDHCGPASVQIALSSLGVAPLDMPEEPTFVASVNVWTGPFTKGNPAGIAGTINRYAPARTGPTRRAYAVLGSASPYVASARIVNALLRYASPSVAMVYKGEHWVTVVGAHGTGTPYAGEDYEISGFWVQNPAWGPAIEHVAYKDWLYVYLTGCSQYDAIEQFIIVSNERASAEGTLGLPPPEPPGPLPTIVDPVAAARRGLADFGLSATIVGATQDPPVPGVVAPPKTSAYTPYYIVPFTLPDQTITVVRVEAATGTYLGTAFGLPPGSVLDPNLHAIRLAQTQTFGIFPSRPHAALAQLLAADPSAVDRTITWYPSTASATPFAPFLRIGDGTSYIYVTQDGRILPEAPQRVRGLG